MLRLRRYLDARGISMRGCAELLNVSEKTLFNKTSGATDFTYTEIKRLKTIFPEYDIDYLLSEDTTDRPA